MCRGEGLGSIPSSFVVKQYYYISIEFLSVTRMKKEEEGITIQLSDLTNSF